jgi:hypothetical protein
VRQTREGTVMRIATGEVTRHEAREAVVDPRLNGQAQRGYWTQGETSVDSRHPNTNRHQIPTLEARMLFIDTNSYLEFFKGSQPSLQKLLPALIEVREEIFVTQQVVWEIQRSKLRITAELLTGFAEKYKPVSVRLPAHLDAVGYPKIASWNKEAATLYKGVEEHAGALNSLIANVMSSVSESRDRVSTELNKVFTFARIPSGDALKRAIARKELGNAPGKPGDPIGDQVSWEMILEAIKPGEALWLVTRDKDYATPFAGKRYLNAQLMGELQSKLGDAPIVHLFDSMADALKHFSLSRSAAIKNLPSEEELKDIAREEAAISHSSLNSPLYFHPQFCQTCGSANGFEGPVPKPSRFGGWTYQWLCKSCHKWADYGEPYDD